MAIGQSKHAIGTFYSRQAAQQALYQLRESGLSLDKVSVITKDTNRNRNADIKDRIGNKAGDVGTMGEIAGTAAGTMLGLVEGLVVLLIPGVEPTLAIGTVLANTLLAGGIGTTGGALMGGLINWGIPAERAGFYHDRLSQGYYLLIVESTEYDLRRAEPIFAAHDVQDWSIYDAPHPSA